MAGLGLLLSMNPLFAETDDDSDLPEARELIDRYIEAIGGRDAVMAQAEAVMTGEFSMPAAGITAQMKVAARPPAEQVVIVDLPGMGEMRTGVSRDLAWSLDPFMGPRLIEGEEFKSLLDNTIPEAVLRDPEYVESVSTVGRDEFLDQACYRVRIEWKSGRESHDCYAAESGLLIAMQSTETSPMGEIDMLSTLDEYREIEGVKVATVIRQTVMGQEQVMTIEDIRFETPDAALFELPPAIQTLVEDRDG